MDTYPDSYITKYTSIRRQYRDTLEGELAAREGDEGRDVPVELRPRTPARQVEHQLFQR